MPTDLTVSLLAEIPEDLHHRIQDFLTGNPAWDADDFVTCALAMFLMQIGDSSTSAARIYLDRMFKRLEATA